MTLETSRAYHADARTLNGNHGRAEGPLGGGGCLRRHERGESADLTREPRPERGLTSGRPRRHAHRRVMNKEFDSYFRPPGARPERAVLSASRALRAASSGEVTSPLLTEGNDGRPCPEGALSEEVFGAVGDPARATRYGHVALVEPVSHPSLARPTASAVGTSGCDLRLDCVPVPPPARRPLVRMPGGAWMPGLDNVRYQDLIAADLRLRAALDAGDGALAEVRVRARRGALQVAFDALCAQYAGGAPPRATRFPRSADGRPGALAGRPEGEGLPGRAGAPEEPTGCAFLGDDAAVIVFPAAAVVVSLVDGAVRASFPAPLLQLLSVREDGRAAAFASDGDLYARDLHADVWLDEAPQMPIAAAASRAGETYLTSAAAGTAVALVEVLGPLSRWSTSPDGRLCWAEDTSGRGGVYDAETGLRWLDRAGWDLDRPVPELLADGGVVEAPDARRWWAGARQRQRRHGRRTDSTFVLAHDGAWRFLDLGLLVLDGEPRCRLDFVGTAAAFDRAGRRLLVVGGGHLVLVEPAPSPRVLARASLDDAAREAARLAKAARGRRASVRSRR